jgi:catechol 2,3-dioxygenase-like lactoylglutathione lyase family enzyme
MAQVLGIGGVFFRAADPAALGGWYRRVLGLEIGEWNGAMFPAAGQAYQVFSLFPADTEYFGTSGQGFMINLMVDDLDGVLEKAKAEGVEPLKREDGDYGRFAWVLDPAGTKVELWEPAPDGES